MKTIMQLLNKCVFSIENSALEINCLRVFLMRFFRCKMRTRLFGKNMLNLIVLLSTVQTNVLLSSLNFIIF